MSRIGYIFGTIAVLAMGCSNSTSTIVPESSVSSLDSLVIKTDTIVISNTIVRIDTVLKVDTALQYDTVPYYLTDTVYVPTSNPYSIPNVPRAYTDTVNIVFFGNSLLRGYSTFGMSASDPSQDYYYKVNSALRSNGIYTNSIKVPTGNFESILDSVAQNELLEEYLYPKISKETDYVFLQIGDNVNTNALVDNWDNSMSRLIKGVQTKSSSKTKIYAVATWYTTDYTNRARAIIERRANLDGIGFIDISQYNTEENRAYIGQVVYRPTLNTYHITYDSYKEVACTLTITFTVLARQVTVSITPDSWEVDEENKVITWIGHEYIVTNPGIASHPGDKGFTAIAGAIVEAVMSDYE